MKPIPKIEEVISDFPEFEGIHPIANAFPMQLPEDFWELVENIKVTGVIHPLRREKGTNLLIDGRNRLIACAITGTLFEVEDIEPNRIYNLVTGDNFHSKKYDASQKAVIAKRLKPFYAARAKERQQEHGGTAPGRPKNTSGKNSGSDARDAAGAVVGVNGRYVDMAEQVASVSPELEEDVLQGRVNIRDAYNEVRPALDQAKAQAKAEKPAKAEKQKTKIITADGRETEIDKPEKPVFNQTNESVSWASWTWNPVTGCNHGCNFCYAREIANSDRMATVYPFQFAPAFHEYRLDAPRNTKHKQSNHPPDGRVFVCSMADLFGKWVPEGWIQKVFESCSQSPEWEYLFLTKWPKRYAMLASLPKAWFGASIIKQSDVERVTRDMTSFEAHSGIVRWVSLEPMLEPIAFGDLSWCDLVVIGAQTSTRQPDGPVPAFSPDFEWVADVVSQCREQGIPYYLKPNLATAPGMKLTQMEPRRR